MCYLKWFRGCYICTGHCGVALVVPLPFQTPIIPTPKQRTEPKQAQTSSQTQQKQAHHRQASDRKEPSLARPHPTSSNGPHHPHQDEQHPPRPKRERTLQRVPTMRKQLRVLRVSFRTFLHPVWLILPPLHPFLRPAGPTRLNSYLVCGLQEPCA